MRARVVDSESTSIGVLDVAQPANSTRRIVIIGGGLAGMATAVALESAGLPVTLLEARATFGGRAGSFEDPQSGEELDNCQHVLLGCCTNLIDFYRRLGVLQLIRFERAIHFVDAKGKRHDLWGFRKLPAPLHLGLSLARFSALTFVERLALTRAMLAMMRLGREGRMALADVPFGQWLDDHRQPASLVDKLYEPILVSALNENARLAGAAYAIQVFQDALLTHAEGYLIGLPTCSLAQLYEKLPCRDVRLATRVSKLEFVGNAVNGVRLLDGSVLPADMVVLATNYPTASKWIPAELACTDRRFERLDDLQSVPILGAHLWFDRPVLTESHAALMSGPLQWLFRKDSSGRAVHGVISAARDWVGRDKDQCLGEFEQQIRSTFPAARSAKLERGVIVIEKRATYSPLPGVDAARPSQAPGDAGIQNLFLAGDYTQSGWPATMEGAVRSGYLAAEAIIGRVRGASACSYRFVVPDLPPQWPARFVK